MLVKIYIYKNCSTCTKALNYLNIKGIKYSQLAIIDAPPNSDELKKMLGNIKRQGGSIKTLFNTSGVQYRELDIASKFKAGLTEDEALLLLAANGKLIKRPFLLVGTGGTVGFKTELWDTLFP